MRAIQLSRPAKIETDPLQLVEIPPPAPEPDELLLKIKACGVCHTDLHIVEGDIQARHYPITPGHQIVGEVVQCGEAVQDWKIGDRAGIAWFSSSCKVCEYCQAGLENLCAQAQFTGFHVDGGYGEFATVPSGSALRLPEGIGDLDSAPLLCAGIIGYRSLRLAEVRPGSHVGLAGFGASAHLAIQVANHWGCKVHVFTRSEGHRELARSQGAFWVGGIEDPGAEQLDSAILFAPVGTLVPPLMERLSPGGTLAINAIHLSPIPEMDYSLIYQERTIRSVANATPRDGHEFLELAAAIPIRAQTSSYDLEDANQALKDMPIADRLEGKCGDKTRALRRLRVR